MRIKGQVKTEEGVNCKRKYIKQFRGRDHTSTTQRTISQER